MTNTGRKTACVVLGVFIAAAGLPFTTRLADAAAAGASEPDDPQFAGHFSGRVTGPDGKPLGGATLFLAPLSGGRIRVPAGASNAALTARAETDGDGRFEFEAQDATYIDLDGLPARRDCLLIANADGYGPDWITIPGRQPAAALARRGRPAVNGTDLALQLVRDDVPICGRFLDADGQPLAGAHVQLYQLRIPRRYDLDAYLEREKKADIFGTSIGYERWLHEPRSLPGLITETRTDADGRFTLSGLGRERLAELRVSAPGVVDTHPTVITRDVADVPVRRGGKSKLPPDYPLQVIHGAKFTLQLKPGGTLKGRVIDRATRRPIPGMWVGMQGDTPLEGLSAGEYSRATDANGRFAITGIHPALLRTEVEIARRAVMAVSAPGLHYQSASVAINGDSEVVIECPGGIPFRLKVDDEQGQPVAAEVTYIDVQPNPHVARTLIESRWPISRAAHRPDGSYEGFVVPGPGVVRVKTRDPIYRPAHVDPKSFFAPGRTEWTLQERTSAYGNQDIVSSSNTWLNQHDYEALVLVNPQPDSEPLELSATVVRDRPRQVSLVDGDGVPVVGVQARGMTFGTYALELPLRAASFPLRGLHPDRVRRITFYDDNRQLVGFLMARGDGDTPYTVRMRPWATVRGRIVDEDGKPTKAALTSGNTSMVVNTDPEVGEDVSANTDSVGQFQIDRLVPGQKYSVSIYRGRGNLAGMAFENLVLGAGEVRQLGDIPTSLPFDPRYLRPTTEQQQATARIPAEAWGEPQNGLRVAIVLRSPPVDENDRLGYEIVAENTSNGDIRFAASIHDERGFCKIGLVDRDGLMVPRRQGILAGFADPPKLIRLWLKPKERAVIGHCFAQLMKLDEAGRTIGLPTRGVANHSFSVMPGRYHMSAVVELGPRIESIDPASGTRQVTSPAEGEWSGKLQTGVVIVPLFEAAGN